MADIRNLVVFFDGTWNKPDNTGEELEAATNVQKMSMAIASLNGGQRQHYEEGVGTGFQEYLAGGVIGAGITDRLLKGYSFLQEMYSDSDYNKEDNRVFIFGFSRGAYIARLLSNLIDWSGIPTDSKDCETGMASFLDGENASTLKDSGRFFNIPIEMVGVWDTVKTALINDYNDTMLPQAVVSGYHAMAIDEKRFTFPVLRWSNIDSRMNEMWFAGVHSDVGGGYSQSGLSNIALRWMIEKARSHGLKFKVKVVNTIKPDPLAEKHDSYKDWYWKVPPQNPRNVMDRDLVHESVKQKIDADYTPDAARWPANPCYSA